MPANSFAGSSSTCCPKASIASATTACLLARTAPRRSRKRASSWVWPRLRPKRRSKSIRRRRRCSPSLAPAVAAACSSSRPSRAANHATIQPRLSSQSGSTPHEHGCHITHPHRQTRFSLVTTRPRRRSTGQPPVSAFHSAIDPESHPHRCKREPETHQRPSSPNRHALSPRLHRQHRDQIAIAPASASAPLLPRVPSLEAFGRRPPCKPNRRDGPSSETLNKTGKAQGEHMFSALPPKAERFLGSHAHLADAKTFAAFLAPLSKKRWFVYAKRPFAGPKAVLAYLSRYTHRVAISNRRLIAVDQRSVTFKVKDYRIEGPGRYTTMTLDAGEFIRRFLIHVLPKGFHRIRHYGLFASANRAETIARARELLGLATPAAEEAVEIDPAAAQPLAQPCPCCGGRMFVIETFEAGCQPRHHPTAPLVAIRIDTS